MFPAYRSLLPAPCSLLPAPCPLLPAHCPLPAAHCPLPTAHCPLPTAPIPLSPGATVPRRQGRNEFEAEVRILSGLHHPHVVLLIGSCPDKVRHACVGDSILDHRRRPSFTGAVARVSTHVTCGTAGHDGPALAPRRLAVAPSCTLRGMRLRSQLAPPPTSTNPRAQGILVYELMPNGSLETHLFGWEGGRSANAGGARGPVPLGWRHRVRIAAEVASALLFLHSAPTPIVHME